MADRRPEHGGRELRVEVVAGPGSALPARWVRAALAVLPPDDLRGLGRVLVEASPSPGGVAGEYRLAGDGRAAEVRLYPASFLRLSVEPWGRWLEPFFRYWVADALYRQVGEHLVTAAGRQRRSDPRRGEQAAGYATAQLAAAFPVMTRVFAPWRAFDHWVARRQGKPVDRAAPVAWSAYLLLWAALILVVLAGRAAGYDLPAAAGAVWVTAYWLLRAGTQPAALWFLGAVGLAVGAPLQLAGTATGGLSLVAAGRILGLAGLGLSVYALLHLEGLMGGARRGGGRGHVA